MPAKNVFCMRMNHKGSNDVDALGAKERRIEGMDCVDAPMDNEEGGGKCKHLDSYTKCPFPLPRLQDLTWSNIRSFQTLVPGV